MSAGAPLSPLVQAGILALPLCFTLGICANDYAASGKAYEKALSVRVSRALGEWSAPVLSDAARRELLSERDDLRREIARLESRFSSASQPL
jgi:hypothetical protein